VPKRRSAFACIASATILSVTYLGAPPAVANPESPPPLGSYDLAAMTWNMCGDKYGECEPVDEPGIEHRIDEVVQEAQRDPDLQVIALQEICGALHYPRILDRLNALPGHEWFGNFWRKPNSDSGTSFKPCQIPDSGYIGSAILLKNPSGHIEQEDVFLNDHPANNIPVNRWGTACLRDIGHPSGRIYVCSAHFPPAFNDSTGVQRRTLAIEMANHLEAQQDAGYATIFGGDVNINSRNASTNAWLDVLREHSIGINLAHPTTDGGSTIDHIFFGHRDIHWDRVDAAVADCTHIDHHELFGYVDFQ
jgi:hypothetical protein